MQNKMAIGATDPVATWRMECGPNDAATKDLPAASACTDEEIKAGEAGEGQMSTLSPRAAAWKKAGGRQGQGHGQGQGQRRARCEEERYTGGTRLFTPPPLYCAIGESSDFVGLTTATPEQRSEPVIKHT